MNKEEAFNKVVNEIKSRWLFEETEKLDENHHLIKDENGDWVMERFSTPLFFETYCRDGYSAMKYRISKDDDSDNPDEGWEIHKW